MKKIGLIIIVLVMIVLALAVKKSDDNFVKGCMEAGYSKNYCESHK